MDLLIEILRAAVQLNASDIHLTVGAPPLTRLGGQIVPIKGFDILTAERCRELVYSALLDHQRAKFEERLELDCPVSVPHLARFRMNVMQQHGAVEAVLRTIPLYIPTPETIGLGPVAMTLADLPRGLVLVTGPTGSGKSTTLACMIEHINLNYNKHIITIEDPIEFAYERKKSLIRQREVGADTHSFQEALRHALRQDPDVILVGEMRDLETISLALSAAETGHLCLATLHTFDAAQTVDRIVDVYPPVQQQQVRAQLANVLKGVVSQMLLPRKDGRGLIAARELMIVTPAISNLIREGKSHMISNVIETSGALGMYTIDKALSELVRRGAVEMSDAKAKAHRPEALLSTQAPNLQKAGVS